MLHWKRDWLQKCITGSSLSEPHTSMNSSCMRVRTNHLLNIINQQISLACTIQIFLYVMVYATVVSDRNCKRQWITGHRHMIVNHNTADGQLWMTTVQAFACCADGSSEGKCPNSVHLHICNAWHRWTYNLLGYYPLHSAHLSVQATNIKLG